MIDKDFRTPIDELIDLTVQQCPVDYRRKLYSVGYILRINFLKIIFCYFNFNLIFFVEYSFIWRKYFI
jgi:hypothetical protein